MYLVRMEANGVRSFPVPHMIGIKRINIYRLAEQVIKERSVRILGSPRLLVKNVEGLVLCVTTTNVVDEAVSRDDIRP